MGQFSAKYSEDERQAIIYAGVDRNIKPVAAICKLAAAGELTYKGEKVPPFEIPNATARGYIERAKHGREGLLLSHLGAQPPKDAVEDVRRRLVNLVDYALKDTERKAKRSKKPVDPEYVRKIARALREIAALPGPGDSRLPVAPGIHARNGEMDGQTRDSLAGSILRAEKPSKRTYVPDLGETVELPATSVEDAETVSAGPEQVLSRTA